MIPEDLDLAALSRELHQALGPGEPIGYLRGKAKMRDALVDLRGFSQLEAESVVDTLELPDRKNAQGQAFSPLFVGDFHAVDRFAWLVFD